MLFLLKSDIVSANLVSEIVTTQKHVFSYTILWEQKF